EGDGEEAERGERRPGGSLPPVGGNQDEVEPDVDERCRELDPAPQGLAPRSRQRVAGEVVERLDQGQGGEPAQRGGGGREVAAEDERCERRREEERGAGRCAVDEREREQPAREAEAAANAVLAM